jgi:L-lactate dehydrogenase complex protein LldG
MTAMGARERMLGKLRAAAPRAPDSCDRLDLAIDAHYDRLRAANPRSSAQRVQAMQAALTASHATVWCADAASWPAQLAARLAQHGVRRLLFDATSAEGAALARALPETTEALAFTRPLEQWKSELFDTVDAGFTVARSGIATSGTLILAPDGASPRTVSLVPPLHIALVYASTLHADLHAAMRSERWSDAMPTNLILASGPSKTSDIQQTLAYGAHGPRWMWVIIVADADADAVSAAAATTLPGVSA